MILSRFNLLPGFFLLECLVLAWAGNLVAQEGPPPLPRDTLQLDFQKNQPSYPFPEKILEPAAQATANQFNLGRRLFFDPILSADRTVSCASCHQPDHGFASTNRFSRGIRGKLSTRNTPALLNRGFAAAQFWDGRASTLEEQVLMPIQDENEMGLALEECISRLAQDPAYSKLFRQAFGQAPNTNTLGQALASFVGRLHSGPTPVDRFMAGESRQLTTQELQGRWLYESKGRCWQCHNGPNYSDESFHNTGVGVRNEMPEEGRFAVTTKAEDRGRFKTPTLRGLAFTAPYMHDGSIATLEEVVAFYRRGGNPNSQLDPLMKPLELSEEEAAALVAFLKALSKKV